jgi:hypothetical protein
MKQESAMKHSMQPSFYEGLGKEAITAVVDDFVGRVGNDSRITGCKDGIKGYGVIGQGEALCQCP